jgi:hypothetical protein
VLVSAGAATMAPSLEPHLAALADDTARSAAGHRPAQKAGSEERAPGLTMGLTRNTLGWVALKSAVACIRLAIECSPATSPSVRDPRGACTLPAAWAARADASNWELWMRHGTARRPAAAQQPAHERRRSATHGYKSAARWWPLTLL